MHTILDAKYDDCNGQMKFYTNSGYILTVNKTTDNGYPNPAVLWIKTYIGEDVFEDINYALRRKFEVLPELLINFIDVAIA